MKQRIRNIVFLTALLLASTGSYVEAQQRVINISTGMNSSNLPLPVGSNDDTWYMVWAGTPSTNAIVSNGTLWDGPNNLYYPGTWAKQDCAQWISPYTVTVPGNAFGCVPIIAGQNMDYRYRMQCTIPCLLQDGGAFIWLGYAGADNSLKQIEVNGNVHSMNINNYNPLASSVYIPLANGELNIGANVIDVIVRNNEKWTGLFLCGGIYYNSFHDPAFNIANNTTNPNFYTLTATPVDPYSQPFDWQVEELDASNNPLFTVANPACWYSSMTNQFNGFDHFANNYSGIITTLNCSSPANGRFLYNRTYRISRGSWNNCNERKTVSQLIRVTRALRPGGNGTQYDYVVNTSEETDNDNTPMTGITAVRSEESHQESDIHLYPNPVTGSSAYLEFESARTYGAVYTVTDLSGREVLSGRIAITKGQNRHQLLFDALKTGVYALRIDGISAVQRVVVQH